MGLLPLLGLAANATVSGIQAHNANNAAKDQNAMRALQLRGATWTGRKPQDYVQGPSVLGEAIKGGASGAEMGAAVSGYMNPKGPSDLEKSQTNFYNSMAGVSDEAAPEVGTNQGKGPLTSWMNDNVPTDTQNNNVLKSPTKQVVQTFKQVKTAPSSPVSVPIGDGAPVGGVYKGPDGNWYDRNNQIVWS